MARIVRVPLAALASGPRELEPNTVHYLCDVLRLQPGDAFVAFDASAGVEADAVLIDLKNCSLAAPRSAARVQSSGITLVQALGKGDKTEQVVRSATALGVDELHLVETARSIARAGDRAESKHARLESIALDAARQSTRGDVPRIAGPYSLSRALEDLKMQDGLKLCLVPGAPAPLSALVRDWTPRTPLALIVGPEGGLADDEIAHAEAAGFVPARFGELVLRTEIAGVAVLGALLLLRDA